MIDYSETLKRLSVGEEISSPLSYDTIEYLHDLSCMAYGGVLGVRDEGLLSSMCEAPFQEFFGETLYPSVFDKAAKYLYDFCHYQVFYDGNKRAGVLSCIQFLKENGWNLTMDPGKLYNLCMDIATDRAGISEISQQIKDNVCFYDKTNQMEEDQLEEEEYDR